MNEISILQLRTLPSLPASPEGSLVAAVDMAESHTPHSQDTLTPVGGERRPRERGDKGFGEGCASLLLPGGMTTKSAVNKSP